MGSTCFESHSAVRAKAVLSPLEERFEELGVTWCKLSHPQTGELVRRWAARYGDSWLVGHRHGPRALAAYGELDCEDFLVGSIPGLGGGLSRAYFCRADQLPDLDEFRGLDLFVTPSDLSWTMVFHHEGGPSFLRAV